MPAQSPLPPDGSLILDDGPGLAAASDQATILRLHAEEATINKIVRRTLVRAAMSTSSHDEVVEADLERHEVVVERIPIGRVVEAVPPVRTEGGVTILPVVEEEFVLVRRLVLKEEVHFRSVRTVSHHAETVTLRKQGVVVTRTPLDE